MKTQWKFCILLACVEHFFVWIFHSICWMLVQSLEKQQTNKDLSGSQHSHMPVQYPRFIGQTNKDPQGSQHSQTPVQYSRFIGQTNKDPQGSQRSHMPVQYPGFIRPTDKDPRGSQHSHMSVQYPGFIGQTNKFPPGNQHSHMPVQYPGFTGHTNKDPSGSQHSCKPVQYPGFVDPQLKVPIAHIEWLCVCISKYCLFSLVSDIVWCMLVKQLQNLRSNMKPPGSHHSQLPQQHLRLTKDQLEVLSCINALCVCAHMYLFWFSDAGSCICVQSLQWQLYMETPLSNNSPQHHSFNEDPLKVIDMHDFALYEVEVGKFFKTYWEYLSNWLDFVLSLDREEALQLQLSRSPSRHYFMLHWHSSRINLESMYKMWARSLNRFHHLVLVGIFLELPTKGKRR